MNAAHRTYGNAKGFCQSAYLVMANPHRLQVPDDTSFMLGFHHLIGFAVELYLKAFLLHCGLSEEELRSKKFGHKLQALLGAAEERGLACSNAKALCTYLVKHETFEFRYMKEDSWYELLPLDTIFDMLSQLDGIVDTEVGASAARGMAAGGSWKFPQDGKYWRVRV